MKVMKRLRVRSWLFLWVLTLILVACGPGDSGDPVEQGVPTADTAGETSAERNEATATAAPTADREDEPTETADEAEQSIQEDDAEGTAEVDQTSEEEGISTVDDRYDALRRITEDWETNWALHSVPYDEIIPAQIRDRIRSIDDPQFVSIETADAWLAGNEPVMAVELDGEARAYPLQILTRHEIVNDELAGTPIVVTYCPLCNSAVVFERTVDGRAVEFGTSGLLRHSDLIMYDRTTETLWQQFTGDAIVGDLIGTRLTFLPSSLVSFEDFRMAFPEGEVLSKDTGFPFQYGANPYEGYDTIGQQPFLFGQVVQGEEGPRFDLSQSDPRLDAMERVVTVTLDDAAVAYPLSLLTEAGVINDSQGGQDLVVFHAPGASSALGAPVIAEGADVGATGVFDPNLAGQKLTFRREDESIVDNETESTWNVLGQAIEGPLAGEQLRPVVHGDHFWFSWAAFFPDTVLYTG